MTDKQAISSFYDWYNIRIRVNRVVAPVSELREAFEAGQESQRAAAAKSISDIAKEFSNDTTADY